MANLDYSFKAKKPKFEKANKTTRTVPDGEDLKVDWN